MSKLDRHKPRSSVEPSEAQITKARRLVELLKAEHRIVVYSPTTKALSITEPSDAQCRSLRITLKTLSPEAKALMKTSLETATLLIERVWLKQRFAKADKVYGPCESEDKQRSSTRVGAFNEFLRLFPGSRLEEERTIYNANNA